MQHFNKPLNQSQKLLINLNSGLFEWQFSFLSCFSKMKSKVSLKIKRGNMTVANLNFSQHGANL